MDLYSSTTAMFSSLPQVNTGVLNRVIWYLMQLLKLHAAVPLIQLLCA